MTKIPWVAVPGYKPESWNPTVGCTPAPGSEKGGCRSCYARVLHDRWHAANKDAAEAAGFTRPAVGERYIREARECGIRLPTPPQYDQPFAKVQLLPERLEKPLHWKLPRAIFVDSMSDLFHPDVPDDFLDRVFAVMALTPQHLYQILTKRPERMREYIRGLRPTRLAPLRQFYGGAKFEALPFIDKVVQTVDLSGVALPNVWLMVSVEDQATADARLPLLLDTPAAVRGVSLEPLLAPTTLCICGGAVGDYEGPRHWCPLHGELRLDWAIVGGESGPGWRPMDLAWVESIQRQCAAAGTSFFGKQAAGSRSGLPLPGDLGARAWPV